MFFWFASELPLAHMMSLFRVEILSAGQTHPWVAWRAENGLDFSLYLAGVRTVKGGLDSLSALFTMLA